MRKLLLLIVLASPAACQFLVKDQLYRCPPGDSACKSPHNLSSFEQPAGGNFTINYVEYKDQGTPWNERQLPDALAQVDKARTDNPRVLVLLYIHGWQNNADEVPCTLPNCNDTVKFRMAVADIASQYFPGVAPAGKAPPVVGIYLAWRGLTFTVEPFKHIVSYWPRRQVARSIGAEGMYQAVSRITARIAEDRSHYVFICMGHSFGARVLENAAEGFDPKHTGFMRQYRQQIKARALELRTNPGLTARTVVNPIPPVDLIFYVNAATSSAVTRRTIADLKDVCKESPASSVCKARPMYFAATSLTDYATGIVMPIANLVIPALKTDGLWLKSAANSPTLHTHHLPSKESCPPPPATFRCAGDGAFCFETGTGQDRTCYKVSPIESKADAPFWLMNVNSDIIKDHGDVWNPNVLAMVKAVFEQNERFREMMEAR